MVGEKMNKNDIYKYLKENNIWHEIMEHKAVYNMNDLQEINNPYPEAEGKNLFVRDDKKQNYYLITVKGDKKVNLKEFRNKYMTRPLSFAKEDELKMILGVIPGAITPLGILNDKELKVQCYIDKEFINGLHLIGVHPNDNTATIWLRVEDLIDIIKKHGNKVNIIEL